MQELSNFTATLNQFVQLFDLQNSHGYKKGGASPAVSCDDPDAIAENNTDSDFAGHTHGKPPGSAGLSKLTVLFKQADSRTPVYCNKQHKACVRALIDSAIDSHGLLLTSYNQVAADYLATLGELDLAELNRVRTYLIHQGPVLGLGCRSTAELKWLFSRHFIAEDFIRDDETKNHQLAKCFNRLLEDNKKLEADLPPLLLDLSMKIFNEGKALRQLTESKVIRLLRCGEQEARCLCTIYNALPNTPLN